MYDPLYLFQPNKLTFFLVIDLQPVYRVIVVRLFFSNMNFIVCMKKGEDTDQLAFDEAY